MDVNIVVILGALTVFISILVKIVGLPDQIRVNRKRKSTSGLSSLFIVLGLLSYILWTSYGLVKKDWVVVMGQGIGVITMGIITFQMWIYRGSKS